MLGFEFEDITSEKFLHVPKNKNSLLKPKFIQMLQDITVCRHNSNNGMSRDEAITMVSRIFQCFNQKLLEYHCKYLVDNKNPY